MAAGVTEGILVVTPSETIKTKMIHDQTRSVNRFNGLLHCVKTIIKEEGFSGLYKYISKNFDH